MVFACQQDSFAKEHVSIVKECTKIEDKTGVRYEIVCEDTVLFPEGGGQPHDTGLLNETPVYQVIRRGDKAIHLTHEPIAVGVEVKQKVDWDRRFDHMQQHSGQHLITAVINAEYQFDTTAWWLGTDVCHIELNTTKLTNEDIERIERIANEKILQQIPVIVKMCDINDPQLDKAHTRGLPDDVAGPIRIVEIVGLEDNLCCGTHVTNTLQLQSIKLLYAEKGKKNKTNLFFLVGGRVLKNLTKCLLREQKLTKILNCDSEQHADITGKLLSNVKIANKKLSVAFKQLASLEAKALLEIRPRPTFHFHHYKDGDQDYIESFLRTVKEDPDIEKTFLLLIVGDTQAPGLIVAHGDAERVAKLGPRVAEILGGKGAAHGKKFQAKVTSLQNLKEVEKLVKNEFSNGVD